MVRRHWALFVLAGFGALLVAVPSILTAAKVNAAAVAATGVGIAAVAGVFAALAKDALSEAFKQHRSQDTAVVEGCLTIGGRLPRVRDVTDPVRLGVHRARPDDADPDRPPAYVPRDIDDELRERLAAGGFLLLVGDSTAGKSRAAYENLSAALPDHVLIAPHDRRALPAGLQAAAENTRCVLWLDDAERFLGADALNSTQVARLLDQPGTHRVILATIRTSELNTYTDSPNQTSPDTYRDIRATLDQAHHIHLKRAFSPAERERAATRADLDPRIGDALEHADAFGIPEYFAAARELLQLWHTNRDSGVHSRGAALVAAAVDARRAGMTVPLPRSLIEDLHTLYLAPRGRLASTETLDEAWAWATKVRTTTALLTPIDSDTDQLFQVFDYLVDYTQAGTTVASRIPKDVFARCLIACEGVTGCEDAIRIAITAGGYGLNHTALEGYVHAIDELVQSLGPENPITLSMRILVAPALVRVGQLTEAEAEGRSLLATCMRVLGPEHKDTLASRVILMLVLSEQGRSKEAEVEIRTVYETLLRIVGPDDPATLTTRKVYADFAARRVIEEHEI